LCGQRAMYDAPELHFEATHVIRALAGRPAT
jgi:hypothetical protein